jgi:hypothetical protein
VQVKRYARRWEWENSPTLLEIKALKKHYESLERSLRRRRRKHEPDYEEPGAPRVLKNFPFLIPQSKDSRNKIHTHTHTKTTQQLSEKNTETGGSDVSISYILL